MLNAHTITIPPPFDMLYTHSQVTHDPSFATLALHVVTTLLILLAQRGIIKLGWCGWMGLATGFLCRSSAESQAGKGLEKRKEKKIQIREPMCLRPSLPANFE